MKKNSESTPTTNFDDGSAFRNHPLIASAHASGENRNVFESFVRGFIGNLQPLGTIEATLAARAAGLAWRLNRAQQLETRILSRPDGSSGHTAITNGLSSPYARKTVEMVSRWEQGLERSLFKTLEVIERRQRFRLQRGKHGKLGESCKGKSNTEPDLLEQQREPVQFDGETSIYQDCVEKGSTP